MAVINRIGDLAGEMTAWRRHLHTIPELGFDCPKTSAFIAETLRSFGIAEIHEGIATSGIVAVIDSGVPGPTIGLRADFDALPITEATGLSFASTHEGKMHACGHDGHTAMLLGAAQYLAETRHFRGRVALIFQPAEESGGGANVMCREGVMERFDISQVFAIHNTPGLEMGEFFTKPGPIMAAVDTFTININGRGGHAASPHRTLDPVVAACGMVQAIQTIVSRNHQTGKDLVVSVTQIHTGTVDNVIPGTAFINGTIRTFDSEVRDMVARRLHEIVPGQAASYGVEAELLIETGYPATRNDAEKTDFAVDVAREIVGPDRVDNQTEKVTGSEDFAYMLEERPGAYVFLGSGEGPGLHHPEYNFNDEIAPIGASFFARLVERAQPLNS